ncbi:hypothetical protein CspHIS471_0407720 [Cutaneotrichosporon sp. HIS471]|nr:hypothetical protein CspHIS471_0407720 [Cutaneotrichosporon sp. HIS471]
MKISTILLPLVAVAYAAPTDLEARNNALGPDGGSLNELFRVEGDVLIGPGGYFDKDGFHPEAYKGAQKREHEERQFRGDGLRVLGPGWQVRYGVLIGPNAWWGPSGWHWGRYPYGPWYGWW